MRLGRKLLFVLCLVCMAEVSLHAYPIYSTSSLMIPQTSFLDRCIMESLAHPSALDGETCCVQEGLTPIVGAADITESGTQTYTALVAAGMLPIEVSGLGYGSKQDDARGFAFWMVAAGFMLMSLAYMIRSGTRGMEKPLEEETRTALTVVSERVATTLG